MGTGDDRQIFSVDYPMRRSARNYSHYYNHPGKRTSGSKVTIAGANFAPSSAVSMVTFGGAIGICVEAPPSPSAPPFLPTNSDGSFKLEMYVSPLTSGSLEVAASVRGISATTIFEVTGQFATGITVPFALSNALSPLGNNLEEGWLLEPGSDTWRYYLPRLISDGINPIASMVDGKIYWLRITANQTVALILNGKQCVLFAGWNLFAW